ncbi:MAG TPA: hypothetical protein VNV66_16445 [Pilimelia sp.]|nr:hypothetical protein [Pilimelia sp.]
MGAVAALGAGALALSGPAYASAATADLELTVTGNSIAATSSGKVNDVTVINHGPDAVAELAIEIDWSQLDTSRVEITKPDACEAEPGKKVFYCGYENVKSGEAADLGFELVRKGAVGPAGKLTFTVAHEGTDKNLRNNTKTVNVAVTPSGPDLYAFAYDVPTTFAGGEPKVGTVAPGAQTRMVYEVGNFGDVPTTGLKLQVTLPNGATFAEVEEDCTYNSTNTVATCTYDKFVLVPADADKPGDEIFAAARFYHLINIAAGVRAPSTLKGGVVAVAPIVAATPPAAAAVTEAQAELPEGVEGVAASEENAEAATGPQNSLVGESRLARDADRTDNSDEFHALVAKAAAPTTPAPGAGGGAGELPVTGAKAGLIGGAGAAVLVVGGVLLLSARQRRVVLVTPGDEKPTA